ncbi:hypothetical protein [Sulfobacillus harzensis]|uniref:DUF916 domain-containing protein n=1 Tax=Sulfobacillus harzensis TaxID=2729629 RepID=A0A7Y0Q2Y7_9FIRM|nr:hypothetical protein [Sulfobacillus harzensis]NMP23027.1 hypothetical protein [Sulfobacillus harzensis]
MKFRFVGAAALAVAVVGVTASPVVAATAPPYHKLVVMGRLMVTPADWGRLSPGQPWSVAVKVINESPDRLVLHRQVIATTTGPGNPLKVVPTPQWLSIPRTITLPPHGAVSVPIRSSGGPGGSWAVNWSNALRSGVWDPASPINASAGVEFAVGPGYPWSSHPVFAGSLAVFNITNNPRYRPPRPAPQRACVSPSWVHARAPWLVWSPRAVVTASVTNLGHTPISPILAVRAAGIQQSVGIGSIRTSATHRFRVKLPMIGLTRITVDAAGAAPVTRMVVSLPGVWLLVMAMAGLSAWVLRLVRRQRRPKPDSLVEDHQ